MVFAMAKRHSPPPVVNAPWLGQSGQPKRSALPSNPQSHRIGVPTAQPRIKTPPARLGRASAVVQRAEVAEVKDANAEDHAAIWKWIQSQVNVAPYFKDGGPEMYFVKVGFEGNICHHFAFGNLQGDRKKFDLDVLMPEVNQLIFKPNNYANVLPKRVDVIEAGQDQSVCLMGTTAPPTDHSARQEIDGGLWWNKFNGLAYVLGFTTPTICGYKVSHFLTVKTAKGGYDAKKIRWRKPA